MIYLKGKTELLEKVKDGEVLANACPLCGKDLVYKQFRVWGTVFFIPIDRTSETRPVYECQGCYETLDVAMRKTYINRAKYKDLSAEEADRLSHSFSLTILGAILSAGNRSTGNKMELLNKLAADSGINREEHAGQFSEEWLLRQDLTEEVFEWFDIFRDTFIEEYRSKALNNVTRFLSGQVMQEKERKLLYTFWRHWGWSKEDFEKTFDNS